VRAQDVRLLERDAARDLAVGALPQHDRVVGEPVVTSAARKPAAERQRADEDRDREADADRGGERWTRALVTLRRL
jgi:hypothetical protein